MKTNAVFRPEAIGVGADGTIAVVAVQMGMIPTNKLVNTVIIRTEKPMKPNVIDRTADLIIKVSRTLNTVNQSHIGVGLAQTNRHLNRNQA